MRRFLGCCFLAALTATVLIAGPPASAAHRFPTTLHAEYFGSPPTAEGSATSAKAACEKRIIVVYVIRGGHRVILGKHGTDRHGLYSFLTKAAEPNTTGPVEVVTRKTLNDGAIVCLPTHQDIAIQDADADGYWATTTGTDCNDNDPTIHPGAPETIGDGIDSNCNVDDNT